jgi:CubicO group peptidase (beta-lactamase class C family)
MINETDYSNNPLTKEQENQIDDIFAQYDTTDKPGCAVGVIQDGRFIYKKSFGMANLEHGIPITSSSKFEIGSDTKQFTATCIALLQIDGKLTYDDDIRKLIPELPNYGEKITIKNLIFHTSGLMDYTNLMRIRGINYDECYYNNEDIIRLISKIKELNFRPGEKYLYSDTGYVLLAEIISRVSGQSFAKYVKEKIFDPLGMDNTQIIDNWKQIIKNRATSYHENDDGEYDTYVHISENIGGIGVITTINDFLLWDQNYYSGKVGGPELQKIISNLKRVNDTSENELYGLGLCFYEYKSISVVSHSGDWLGYVSDPVRYPEYKTSVVVFFNNEHEPNPMIKSVTDIILADIIKEPNTELISKEIKNESFNTDLEKFYGYYCAVQNVDDNGEPHWQVHDASGNRRTIKIYNKDGDLFYWRNNDSESRLKRISENEFIMDVKYPIVFKNYEPVKYSLEKLHKYSGNFYSQELEVEYQIKVDNDKLVIYIKDKKMSELTLILDNLFLIDEWYSTLKYCFNDRNEISGLILDSYRVQNMQFVKQPE